MTITYTWDEFVELAKKSIHQIDGKQVGDISYLRVMPFEGLQTAYHDIEMVEVELKDA